MPTEKGPAPNLAGAVPTAFSAGGPSEGVNDRVRSVRYDMMENVRFILKGLSFEDKCLVVGCRAAYCGIYGRHGSRCGRRDSGCKCTCRPDGSPRHRQ